MNNKIFFLRHAETKVDSDTPISKWVLTEEGAKQAEELAKSDVFDEIDIIISSDEDKAFLTA
ncbi:MAG: histidine phosphatase family protein, partial [Nanoarchaeota archaeon]|nr:histidine phosphatase family protein [Nanoarchaeota archaeon]